MEVLATLFFSAVFMGLLYRMYYLPVQKEKKTAIGVVLTEEGLASRETKRMVRWYKAAARSALLVAGGAFLLAAASVYYFGERGYLLELFSVLFVWNNCFYVYQKYHRKMILLKLDNQWNDDMKKRTCFLKEHIGVHNLELANDLVFIPLFLVPFRAFFYPAAREYLQGNLWNGFLFLLPFVIILLLLAVYYKGLLDRNLTFMFACIEAASMYALQWKILAAGRGIADAAAMYLLFLLLGVALLIPYIRDIRADAELYKREFPVRSFSEGEEFWLYGYYRNKNNKAALVKRKKGWIAGLNHAQGKVKVLLLLIQAAVYGGAAFLIWQMF